MCFVDLRIGKLHRQHHVSAPGKVHRDFSRAALNFRSNAGSARHRCQRFFERTGCPIVVNTSFNLSWEPIVLTPEEAYRTFMESEMDALVLENFILERKDQPPMPVDESWKSEFALD